MSYEPEHIIVCTMYVVHVTRAVNCTAVQYREARARGTATTVEDANARAEVNG